jgi:hypothetical protein
MREAAIAEDKEEMARLRKADFPSQYSGMRREDRANDRGR